MDIKQFSKELRLLILENENQLYEIKMLKTQLLILLANNNGRIDKMDYKDADRIDFAKINMGICYTGFSAMVGNKLIKRWSDVPMK